MLIEDLDDLKDEVFTPREPANTSGVSELVRILMKGAKDFAEAKESSSDTDSDSHEISRLGQELGALISPKNSNSLEFNKCIS